MDMGGQNNTYEKTRGGGEGGKGSERDSVSSKGSGGMTRFLVLISRITKALVSQYLLYLQCTVEVEE